MNYHDVKCNRDFKKAVRNVVSGNFYVDDEYVYC